MYARARARMRARVCVCVCVMERKAEGERGKERERVISQEKYDKSEKVIMITRCAVKFLAPPKRQ